MKRGDRRKYDKDWFVSGKKIGRKQWRESN